MAAWWSWGERPARVQAEASRILTDLERTWGPLPSSVDVRVALPRSQPEVVQQLREAVGAVSVHDEAEARMRHAIGQSYPELLDAALAKEGVTLGHYPQSFERSTVGGWVATRSVGQFSTGVGSIAELVAGLRAISPTGDIVLPAQPAASEGIDLRELLLGSEGRCAVITEATLRVRPRPEEQRVAAWRCASFAEGAEVIRALLQEGADDLGALGET